MDWNKQAGAAPAYEIDRRMVDYEEAKRGCATLIGTPPSQGNQLEVIGKRLEDLVGKSGSLGNIAGMVADRVFGQQPANEMARDKEPPPHSQIAEIHALVTLLGRNLDYLSSQIERLDRL